MPPPRSRYDLGKGLTEAATCVPCKLDRRQCPGPPFPCKRCNQEKIVCYFADQTQPQQGWPMQGRELPQRAGPDAPPVQPNEQSPSPQPETKPDAPPQQPNEQPFKKPRPKARHKRRENTTSAVDPDAIQAATAASTVEASANLDALRDQTGSPRQAGSAACESAHVETTPILDKTATERLARLYFRTVNTFYPVLNEADTMHALDGFFEVGKTVSATECAVLELVIALGSLFAGPRYRASAQAHAASAVRLSRDVQLTSGVTVGTLQLLLLLSLAEWEGWSFDDCAETLRSAQNAAIVRSIDEQDIGRWIPSVLSDDSVWPLCAVIGRMITLEQRVREQSFPRLSPGSLAKLETPGADGSEWIELPLVGLLDIAKDIQDSSLVHYLDCSREEILDQHIKVATVQQKMRDWYMSHPEQTECAAKGLLGNPYRALYLFLTVQLHLPSLTYVRQTEPPAWASGSSDMLARFVIASAEACIHACLSLVRQQPSSMKGNKMSGLWWHKWADVSPYERELVSLEGARPESWAKKKGLCTSDVLKVVVDILERRGPAFPLAVSSLVKEA